MRSEENKKRVIGDFDSALKLETVSWTPSEDGTYYSAEISYCAGNTVPQSIAEKYQYLVVYAPAAYFKDHELDRNGKCNGLTADSAPVIFKNNCFGWKSSVPRDANAEWLSRGWIHVECGARSRDADEKYIFSKSPCQIVDLKSGIRMLRLNRDVLPGDYDKLISFGFSGGGQMSSMLGASGNMEAYFSLLWENGAAGISRMPDGTFENSIDDSVFGCMCFAPIACLQMASLAHAWSRFDSDSQGGSRLTPFQRQLEKDMAVRFCEYVNELRLKDEAGNILSFDIDAGTGRPDPRKGSYYKRILGNVSESFNRFAAAKDELFPYRVQKGMRNSATFEEYASFEDLLAKYINDGEGHVKNGTGKWIKEKDDGTYEITDLSGFFHGAGIQRLKGVPAFDGLYWDDEKKGYGDGRGTTENDAFGRPGQGAVHYSRMIGELLENNYEEYSKAEGFDADTVDTFIKESSDTYLEKQLYLMDSMQIMLNSVNNKEKTKIAPFWRVRMGSEDQNSFACVFNFALAAKMAGADVDYGLVWAMGHSVKEGKTTGTFEDWVSEISHHHFQQ